MVGIPGAAFIEGHHDVGTDDALGVHVVFGCESMAAAVDVALEGAPFRGELAYGTEAENLEPAAVGKYGTVPVLEAVQAACSSQYVQPGTQVKMVCVAEYYLGFHIVFKVFMVNPFHRSHGADRHENGGPDIPMVGMQDTAAGR